MNRFGQYVVLIICSIVIIAILGYIGVALLPGVILGLWQLIVLGAAMAVYFLLMLRWNLMTEQQATTLDKKVKPEFDFVKATRLENVPRKL